MRFSWRGAAVLTSLAVLALPLAGCHQGDTDNGVVALNANDTAATVNDQTITQSQFFAQLQNYAPNPQNPTANQPAGRAVLQQLIGDLCFIGLAKQENVAPTDDEVNAQYANIKMVQDASNIKPFEDRLKDIGMTPDDIKLYQIKPQLAQLKLLTKGTPAPTDAQVKSYYDLHKVDQFTKPERAHIKVIALANQADAQDIYQKIQGGQSFDSFLPRSLNKAFVNGEFPQWVPLDASKNPAFGPVITSIKSLNSGQTTKPFAFGGGWWLAEVLEKKSQEVVTYDQVKGLIPFVLMQQNAQQAAQKNPQSVGQLQTEERDYQTKLANSGAIKVNLSGLQYTQMLDDLKNPPPPQAAPSGLPTPPPGPASPPAAPQKH